jgi:septum formation protein
MGPAGKLPLILASASPRRQELLRLASIPLEIIPSQAEERFLQGESPAEHVRRVARAKAMDVAEQHQGRWVLAADTVVAIDGKILGKPKDRREAEEMLRSLSQREHRVVTGYCILRLPSAEEREGMVISRVKFKALTAEEIRWYIDTGEPFDKAGGYAIQGKAALMVQEVHGSYTNVVGLPLCEVVEALRELGAVNLFGTQMNADL